MFTDSVFISLSKPISSLFPPAHTRLVRAAGGDSMAGMTRPLLVLTTITTMGLVTLVTGSKLNVPRVLLPYSDTPPSFSLRSEAGCYRWSNTRPDLVKVNLNRNDACNDAVVRVTI